MGHGLLVGNEVKLHRIGAQFVCSFLRLSAGVLLVLAMISISNSPYAAEPTAITGIVEKVRDGLHD